MAIPYPEGTTALATDSEQRSLVKIVELMSGGGGGGGGGDADWSSVAGNYGGAEPPALLTDRGIGFDTSNDAEWHWYGGSWH